MWHLFLKHWNGINLFLPPYTETSPDIYLYTDVARGIGYGDILWESVVSVQMASFLSAPFRYRG